MSGDPSMYICKNLRIKVRGCTIHLQQYDKVILELEDLVIERRVPRLPGTAGPSTPLGSHPEFSIKTIRENYGRFIEGLKGRYDTMDLHRLFQEKRDIKDEILTKLKTKNRYSWFDRLMQNFFNRWP